MAAPTLITGASGLLGRWTLAGWMGPVEYVDRSETDLLLPGSATELIERIRPKTVVHLAWCASGSSDYRTSPENARWVDATLELAAACRRVGAHLIGTGTVIDDGLDPADAYARAKSQLRVALASDIASGAITWARPHYVFDPASRRPALISHAADAAAAGRPLELTAPDARHDFVHAGDVGAAMRLIAEEGFTGVIDIGSGRTHSVREVVEVLGVPCEPSADAVEGASTPAADITRLTGAGWHPIRTEEFFAHG